MDNKNELINIINKYFSKDTTGIVYGTLKQETFDKVVKNARYFEKPDIVSYFEKKLVIIEHFEFDSYKNTKKGSNYKIEEADLERKFNKKIKLNSEVNYIHQFLTTPNLDNYFTNFKDTFIKHYNKIDNYKENVKKINKDGDIELHICFFAEDVTPLGNVYSSNEKLKMVLPINNKEIIQLLLDHPLVEYIVIGNFFGDEYRMTIIENNKSAFENFINTNEEFDIEKYIEFKPHVICFSTIIDNTLRL